MGIPALIRPRLLALVTLLLLLPGAAHAAAFGVREIRVWRLDTQPKQLLDENDLKEFFNVGHCQCATPIAIEVLIEGDFQSLDYDFQVVAGRACLDPDNESILSRCKVLFGPTRVSTLSGDLMLTKDASGNVITAKMLMEDSCEEVDLKSYTISVFTDKDDNERWEELSTKKEYTVDTSPPDSPRNATVEAGEGQVVLSFSAPTTSTSTTSDGGTSTTGTTDKNIKGYQVLCETGDGSPAFSSPSAPGFAAAINLCGSCGSGSTTSSLHAASDLGVSDGGLRDGSTDARSSVDGGAGDGGSSVDSGSTLTGGAAALCSRFICSDLQQSAGSITVSGLTNGTSYRFYLVTIDSALNPSQPVPVGESQPQLVEDLWERYKREGGKADGGYCFVATAAYGSYNHPHVRVLREFRDRVLLPSTLGRRFVASYYRMSPGPAQWLANHGTARTITRGLLWPVTLTAGLYLYTPAWHKAVLLGATLALLLLLGIRRQASKQRQ